MKVHYWNENFISMFVTFVFDAKYIVTTTTQESEMKVTQLSQKGM